MRISTVRTEYHSTNSMLEIAIWNILGSRAGMIMPLTCEMTNRCNLRQLLRNDSDPLCLICDLSRDACCSVWRCRPQRFVRPYPSSSLAFHGRTGTYRLPESPHLSKNDE